MGEINPYKLKISQLRALVVIAEVGSFSDAALQLDLSQSAVSHAIATLEDELGVILLNRGRQGAVLTPVGAQITEEARRVLQSLENICKQAQLAKGLQSGQVRVAGFRSVATHILPIVIEQFCNKYPGISVTINEFQRYSQVEEELRQGRADFGFTYLPTSKEFEAFELLRDRYIVLLPPSAIPIPSPITWEQLTAYPLILPPPQDCCRDMIDQHLARFNKLPQPAYEVKEDSTILSMVQRGLGASIMPQLAAEPIPEDLLVLDLPVLLERVIGVIVLAAALHPPAVFAFIDTLKTVWRGSELQTTRTG
ncbi:MAG: LysR family transcriptional regulator [Pseudanabaenales cyanobacterium]|nr:LysR family transcriptional regulator [Pseudanabaenales cyanobacterium]